MWYENHHKARKLYLVFRFVKVFFRTNPFVKVFFSSKSQDFLTSWSEAPLFLINKRSDFFFSVHVDLQVPAPIYIGSTFFSSIHFWFRLEIHESLSWSLNLCTQRRLLKVQVEFMQLEKLCARIPFWRTEAFRDWWSKNLHLCSTEWERYFILFSLRRITMNLP